jgi:ElaA protein
VDEKDKASFHLFGKAENGKVIAVSRIVPKGVSYDEISIGRVAIKKEFRGKGIADEMMLATFKFIEKELGYQAIRISAQQYLTSFYGKHNFKQIGEMYLEDDIPHIEMLRELD